MFFICDRSLYIDLQLYVLKTQYEANQDYSAGVDTTLPSWKRDDDKKDNDDNDENEPDTHRSNEPNTGPTGSKKKDKQSGKKRNKKEKKKKKNKQKKEKNKIINDNNQLFLMLNLRRLLMMMIPKNIHLVEYML